MPAARSENLIVNVFVWALQFVLGALFLLTGAAHFFLPANLPEPAQWMYELPEPLHWLSGSAEILGGLGLILPSLTRIMPRLTVWAALGLVLTMVGAAAWHATRGEVSNMVQNGVLGLLLAIIAWRRAGADRIEPRASAAR
jgi:uncharacterized membrane protein YphA (DoxX/SURF4 family)